MTCHPEISVIIPVYNASATILKTLHSLGSQTALSIEFIFVNDGSTDNSSEILHEFSSKYENFRVIDTENQGAYLARETGIALSRGKYIGFCDADDIPHPDQYKLLLESILLTGSDMAVCAYKRISGNRIRIEVDGFGDGYRDASSDKGWLVAINTALWNKLIKKEVLTERIHPETPPRTMEDAFLLFSIYSRLNRVSFVSRPLYDYFVADGTAMSHIEPEEVESLLDTWSVLKRHAKNDSAQDGDLIDLGAFIHLGLSANLRLSWNQGSHNYRTVRCGLAELAKRFPNSKRNRYLSFSYIISHPMLSKVWIAHLLDTVHILPAAISLLAFCEKRLSIGVAW